MLTISVNVWPTINPDRHVREDSSITVRITVTLFDRALCNSAPPRAKLYRDGTVSDFSRVSNAGLAPRSLDAWPSASVKTEVLTTSGELAYQTSALDELSSSHNEEEDEYEDELPDDDDDDRDTEDPDARRLQDGLSGHSSELLKREFEYICLNKELQSKSARVVRDAEEVVKEGKATLVRPMTAPSVSQAAENGTGPSSTALPRPVTATRPLTAGKNVKSKARIPSASTRTVTNPRRPPGVEETNSSLGSGSHHPVVDDVPEAVGIEASNRLLKAKLQVMKHDMDKLIAQHEIKNATIQTLEQKLKAIESERNKNARAMQNLHGETNKYQSQTEELKRRAENAEAEVVALKKTLDVHNRAQRHSESETNAKEIRLNRALDEIERRKQLASKASTEAKERLEESKRTLEKLLQDHRRVHKQKAELLTAFKKQLQLVDVLKRQKVPSDEMRLSRALTVTDRELVVFLQIHLESAKLLEIAEQDFVRALNWEV
ncbi:Golgin sub A member 2 [Geranomyces variabilis]|uniref:Golgin sub A member 2 n=1 Tax=Geranomyces variabilis TaxID=109894 RepID=A0AAD5XMT2_9FUNG|nr:Golgin sub A member 2 [Geranomyces variabilis]